MKLSWSKDSCLKKTNHPKTVPMDMLHTSILLKYQLPQLVENRSCLFSPCSVGCTHRCETVKCCPRGSAILLCKWFQKCDILLAGTGGTYENLTDCHRFAWWIDFHHCWAKLHWFWSFSSSRWPSPERGCCQIFFFLWSILFIFLKKKKKNHFNQRP